MSLVYKQLGLVLILHTSEGLMFGVFVLCRSGTHSAEVGTIAALCAVDYSKQCKCVCVCVCVCLHVLTRLLLTNTPGRCKW